ncbi:lipoprotein [Duganella sp. BuS-21]|uniref:LPS translocon maturation chaperone LptM n=1 Tax=Duganella sp. BuS-21 TaxID=2943848 RepID=UPI0035A5A98E
MKSSLRLIILSVLLSGCGQPGPLYLPKPPAAKPAKSGNAPVPTSETAAPQQ